MDRKTALKAGSEISSLDIRSLCGDIPDWKVSAIFGLSPEREEIELAVAWADQRDDPGQQRSVKSKSAQIFDILMAGEEAEEER
jgi:hypothetical protein